MTQHFKHLYDMTLNEVIDFNGTNVRRVPGGWIYTDFWENGAYICMSSRTTRKARYMTPATRITDTNCLDT